MIELLVVVAVITLLIGILLPTLASARRSAWRAVDLSNLRQIGLGGEQYRLDHDRYALSVTQRVRPRTSYTVYGHSLGGKTNINTQVTGSNELWGFIPESERVLNPYLYPEIEAAPWDEVTVPAPEEVQERPFFQSPADIDGARWIIDDQDPSGPLAAASAYEAMGTSYIQNIAPSWLSPLPGMEFKPGGGLVVNTQEERLVAAIERIQRTVSPSRFVLATDPAYQWVFYFGDGEIAPGLHGKQGEYASAFGDGHARFIQIQAEHLYFNSFYAAEGPDYTFWQGPPTNR